VVALTAYNTEKFKRKSLAAGMDDFLTKPINMDKLKELLEKIDVLPSPTARPP
jgi:CheY-like chemotaxis protein